MFPRIVHQDAGGTLGLWRWSVGYLVLTLEFICYAISACLLSCDQKYFFYEQRGHVFLISAAQEITFLIFFDTLGDQFLGVFRCLGTHFRVRGPIWMISGAIVRFSWKKWVHRPPPKGSILGLFSIFFLIVFLECSHFWIFMFLHARKVHFGSHFDSFLRALGFLKNS